MAGLASRNVRSRLRLVKIDRDGHAASLGSAAPPLSAPIGRSEFSRKLPPACRRGLPMDGYHLPTGHLTWRPPQMTVSFASQTIVLFPHLMTAVSRVEGGRGGVPTCMDGADTNYFFSAHEENGQNLLFVAAIARTVQVIIMIT